MCAYLRYAGSGPHLLSEVSEASCEALRSSEAVIAGGPGGRGMEGEERGEEKRGWHETTAHGLLRTDNKRVRSMRLMASTLERGPYQHVRAGWLSSWANERPRWMSWAVKYK